MNKCAVLLSFHAAAAFALLSSCSTIAPFNQRAYEQAISLKVETLALADEATDPYEMHALESKELSLNLEKAYEYARHLPQNEEIARQWAIISDPGRNSAAGLLARWKSKGALDDNFIVEAKGVISDDFDQVIELESGKRKPSENSK